MACKREYRWVILRKRIQERPRGQLCFWPTYEYLYYISNDWKSTAAEIVFGANDRCNQENLVAQLKGGVRALRAPVDIRSRTGGDMRIHLGQPWPPRI